VRWSRGPETDLTAAGGTGQSSQDALTGVLMPGLSANPLRAEAWWGDRSLELWVARRLFDYRHLRELRGPGVRAWILAGEEQGRGPDNEPLVRCLQRWPGSGRLPCASASRSSPSSIPLGGARSTGAGRPSGPDHRPGERTDRRA
jgi:hypothetical protein